MRNLGKLQELFDEQDCNPENWPGVDVTALTMEKKNRFNRRKRALDLYLTTDTPVGEIVIKCGISASELNRIKARAFSTGPDGKPWGYCACVPGLHLKSYERVKENGCGTAGLFSQFLSSNPKIQKQLDDWALGRKSIDQGKIRGRYYKRIWKAFKAACAKAGIDTETEYPFNTSDQGRDAVRRYCRKLKNKNHVRGAIVDYGAEAGAMLAQSGNRNSDQLPLRPYDLVQFDGHRIDGEFIIRLQDASGEVVEKPLSRIWLLVAIDCASRTVLGYSISLSANYTNEDVLECISRVFKPWSPKELPTQKIYYLKGAGLPSGVISSCAWRVFNAIRMDNAYSHLSAWVQGRIIASGANEVITNRPRRPRTNAIVERFNRTFEEETFHQMPNSYGSNPNDPRRDKPEKAAKKLSIDYEDLELIADVAIANYNATPHTSMNGKSPLEYLRYSLDKEHDIPRYVPKRYRDRLPLFDRTYPVTIRGSKATGHRPYIQFKQAKYTSPSLEHAFDLIGEKARLLINIDDIRSGELFLSDGTSLGIVSVEIRWIEWPHSLRTRQAINKLIRERRLITDSHTPVTDYLNYLAERAAIGRKQRNNLLKASYETGIHKKQTTTPKPRGPVRGANWIRLGSTNS